MIISGRGNNFVYVHENADLGIALNVIMNGKSKISACNAVDKVLIDKNLPNKNEFIQKLISKLKAFNIEILGDEATCQLDDISAFESDDIWYEEFLDYKIVIGEIVSNADAIAKINTYSGGHSSSIITRNKDEAKLFMENVDTAAVYHNASTRFTDGGQLGLGGELAIQPAPLSWESRATQFFTFTHKEQIHKCRSGPARGNKSYLLGNDFLRMGIRNALCLVRVLNHGFSSLDLLRSALRQNHARCGVGCGKSSALSHLPH